MATADKDWLLVRSNIIRLMQGADDVAEDPDIPHNVRRYYNDLENLLADIAQALRRYQRER